MSERWNRWCDGSCVILSCPASTLAAMFTYSIARAVCGELIREVHLLFIHWFLRLRQASKLGNGTVGQEVESFEIG